MYNEITDSLRPKRWKDYVGQRRMKERLSVIIDSALHQHHPLDHILLTGPPGAGKTALAELIGHRASPNFTAIKVGGGTDVDALYCAIEDFAGQGGGVIFLDELHNAPRQFQEQLQVALLDAELHTKYHYSIFCEGVTFIGATTLENRAKLLDPLVQRFPLSFTWEPYTDADMALIVQGMATRLGVPLPDDVARELARAAGGTPRFVEGMVKRARDLHVTGRKITVEAVLDLAGLDCDGLTREHLEYLRILQSMGNVAGLKNLTTMMRMSNATIEDLERLLITRGYIRFTSRGRELTTAGRAKAKGAVRVPA